MIISYLILIFHQLMVAVADDSTILPYKPPDNIAIDCGSSGSNKAQDQRVWEGDTNSKFFPLQNQNTLSVASTASLQATDVSQIPYQTARLSRSEFTYTFPVTPGQKFIRLHFNPTTYGDFDTAKAFFSVKSAQFTLLSNFSAFLTYHALEKQNIVKEYCLNVDREQFLNITFAPDVSWNPDSFAFVNGIEVVSMPTNLYYSEDENRGAFFVGQRTLYPIGNETAMEMTYRINVGGAFVSPNGDTGMFRSWDMEADYLTIPGYSVLPVEIKRGLNFTMIPPYTAPAQVYETGRSTGNIKDKLKLQSYNLTWEFSVDSEFFYLVRLHFCEIEPGMNRSGDRVFYIYIANQAAEIDADIIKWSGAQFTPICRDYVVGMLGEGNGKKVNLSIALHVNPEEWRTQYLDALLNGIELFKLNDSSGNLAGPNFDPRIDPPSSTPPTVLKSKGSNNQAAIIGGVVGGVVSVGIILSVVGFLIFRRQRKVESSSSADKATWWGPASFSTTKSNDAPGSLLPSDVCRYFLLAEIKTATNNFDDVFIIGRGGFGNVYKGYVDGGTTAVAIKRLKKESSQGAREFKTEIEMLSQLRHVHLVSLIGYCNDDREMILVYEHMTRGTLREHLYNSDNPPLSWKKRLEICIGAARGLHYLHTGAKHTIIHRDVKTTNILVDEKWEAKVSDFGLSKVGPTNMANAHVSTVVKGSLGYLDPEYYRRQQLTEKSDVYSFGVVLCEVLSARPPIMKSAEKRQISLAEWARLCYRNGAFEEIVDKHLRGKIAPECFNKYGEIAVSCLVDNGIERPSMNDVVWGLEFALQLQVSAEEKLSASELASEMKGESEVALINYSNSDGKFSCSWEDSLEQRSGATKPSSSSEQSSETNQSIKGMSGTVFSEIQNPLAR